MSWPGAFALVGLSLSAAIIALASAITTRGWPGKRK